MTWITDETLSAYLDGEADDLAVAEIERAKPGEPLLVARLANLARNDVLLRDSMDVALGADPEWKPGAGAANVVAFPKSRRPWEFRRDWAWPAVAAAVLVVGLAGVGLLHQPNDGLLIQSTSGSEVGPGLARALSTTRSGQVTSVGGSFVRIALSFQARDGRMCRQFSATQAHNDLAGVACRGADAWHMQGLSHSLAAPTTGYQTAGGSDDLVIGAVIDRLGTQKLLDQPGESAAITAGWKPGTVK